MLRRTGLAALSLSLLLGAAACGSDDPDDGASDGRTITHAMGETRVPDRATRVVVLDTGELDAVAALGITPVGASRPDAGAPIPSYIADALGPGASTIADTGTIEAPNLEEIARLDPDLILSSKVRHEALYPQLSGIAPTVFAETVGVTWKENFLLDADALGRKADAEALLADYRTKATEVGKAYGDPAATSVSVLRFVPEVRLYDKGSFLGTILQDAGFARPANEQGSDTFTDLSGEQLGQVRGDVLFYAGYLGDGAKAVQTATRTPLWKTIGAVRAGRATAVSDEIWFLAIGPVGARLVLDDLQGYAAKLAPRASASTSPSASASAPASATTPATPSPRASAAASASATTQAPTAVS